MLPLDVLTTYGLFTASIVALWFRPSTGARRRLADVSLFPFLASLAVGHWAGFITTLALPFIAVFILSAYIVATGRAASSLRAAGIAAVIVFGDPVMAG